MRLIDADALKSELIAFYADSAELFNEVSCLVDSAKTAEKNPELAPASLKQLDFFQQRRFPPPKKRTPPAEPAQTRRYLAG